MVFARRPFVTFSHSCFGEVLGPFKEQVRRDESIGTR